MNRTAIVHPILTLLHVLILSMLPFQKYRLYSRENVIYESSQRRTWLPIFISFSPPSPIESQFKVDNIPIYTVYIVISVLLAAERQSKCSHLCVEVAGFSSQNRVIVTCMPLQSVIDT